MLIYGSVVSYYIGRIPDHMSNTGPYASIWCIFGAHYIFYHKCTMPHNHAITLLLSSSIVSLYPRHGCVDGYLAIL